MASISACVCFCGVCVFVLVSVHVCVCIERKKKRERAIHPSIHSFHSTTHLLDLKQVVVDQVLLQVQRDLGGLCNRGGAHIDSHSKHALSGRIKV